MTFADLIKTHEVVSAAEYNIAPTLLEAEQGMYENMILNEVIARD